MESATYALLVDPPALKERIVSHLRTMWTERMAAEWQRNLPMLQTCVEAFQPIDFSDATLPEVAYRVMGQALPEQWREKLEKLEIERVIFVPSAHLGPYRSMDYAEGTLWLHFGARLPAGTQVTSPERVGYLLRAPPSRPPGHDRRTPTPLQTHKPRHRIARGVVA
jgi:hypothetical protein